VFASCLSTLRQVGFLLFPQLLSFKSIAGFRLFLSLFSC
jgi:hypothetical protein